MLSYATSQLLYLDTSSGQINKLLKDWFGWTTGALALYLTYIFCIMINLQACILMTVTNLKGPDQSFLASFTWFNAVDAPWAEQWYMAVYIVILTVSGHSLISMYCESFLLHAGWKNIFQLGEI